MTIIFCLQKFWQNIPRIYFFVEIYFHEKDCGSMNFGVFCSADPSLNLAVFANLAKIYVN